MIIKTVARYFPDRLPPIGVWSAGLQWQTPEGLQMSRLLEGESQELGTTGRNIGADVLAVLAGLRVARTVGLPTQVHTVNATVRDTIPIYYEGWKTKGWWTARGKRPHCLAEWQEIMSITEEIPVTWHQRKPTKADKVADYEHWQGWLLDPDDAYLFERAMARNP